MVWREISPGEDHPEAKFHVIGTGRSRIASVPAFDLLMAIFALASIALSLWNMHEASSGVVIETLSIEGTPATIFRPAAGQLGRVVVIAHGFAGSQQLMHPLATHIDMTFVAAFLAGGISGSINAHSASVMSLG